MQLLYASIASVYDVMNTVSVHRTLLCLSILPKPGCRSYVLICRVHFTFIITSVHIDHTGERLDGTVLPYETENVGRVLSPSYWPQVHY